MIIDQHDDINNQYLEKFANAGVVIKPKENVNELPDKDFALIVIKKKRPRRKFPICDKDSTILSSLYLLERMNEMPRTYVKTAGANIKEACVKYDLNIPSELEDFPVGGNKVITSRDLRKEAKEEIPDEQFGLIYKEDGEKVRKFPLIDKKHTKKALDKFESVKGSLDDEQAKKLRQRILEACDKFGININEETEIEKSANIKRDMEYRTRNLTKEAQLPYMKVADMVENDEITIKEAAAVMEKLDKEINLHRTLSPIETLTGNKQNPMDFGERTKVASVEDNLEVILQDDQLKDSFFSKVEEQFSPEIVSGLKQDPATVYQSLPDPHKDLIDNIVSELV